MNVLKVKRYSHLPIKVNDALRYSKAGEEHLPLLKDVISECEGIFDFKVCYGIVDVSFFDGVLDLGFLRSKSKTLIKALEGCRKAVVLGASIGLNIDRLIAKYSSISPSRALLLQGFGTERVESLCDRFCSDMSNSYKMRVSAGYGDIPLEIQRDIFKFLDLERQIGVCLNESLSMSPSKSVTAIMGL